MLYWEYYLAGIVLIPGIIFSIYASFKVRSSFTKYSRVYSRSGMTGAQVARRLLESAGLHDVGVLRTSGHLTDHYDPRSRTLSLSDSVHDSTSVAAIGVAAHEVGHALQHDKNYVPLKMRSAIVPMVNFSSRMLMPIVFLGLFFSFLIENPLVSDVVFLAGIAVFGITLLLTLITLPVEFNASRRAREILVRDDILGRDEAAQAKSVLSAAALTYVASFLMALLSLLRFILVFNRRRR